MAISHVAGSDTSAANSGQSTLAVTTHTLGDVVMLGVYIGNTTARISSISGGGCTGWKAALASPYVSGNTYEIWFGTVTSIVSNTNLTVTFSTTVADTVELDSSQFTAGLGASTVWAVDGTQAAGISNPASTACPYPSLTASAAGELYFGKGTVGSSTAGSGTTGTGTPASAVFLRDAYVDPYCYAIVPSAGPYQPIQDQKSAAISTMVGALFTASTPSTDYTRTAADTVGVTDTAARTQSTTRLAGDTTGITDTAASIAAAARAPADTAGITDAATPTQSLTRAVTDTVGIGDTANSIAAAAATFADSIGVVDLAAQAVTVTDQAVITDTAGAAGDAVRVSPDLVGIADTVAAGLVRAVGDSVAVTDSTAYDLTDVTTVADSIGVVDDIAVAVSAVRTIADLAGLIDAITLAGEWSVLLADAVTVGDVVTRGGIVYPPVHAGTASVTAGASAGQPPAGGLSAGAPVHAGGSAGSPTRVR